MDWAEPEVEVDEDTMATVKILYVRNLMLQTTEETIEKEFNSLNPGNTSQYNTAVKDQIALESTDRDDNVVFTNKFQVSGF